MFPGMRTKRLAAAAVLGLALLASGCGRSFRPYTYDLGRPLFDASVERFERGKYGDAAAGFERLTLELAPRDALMAPSMYYLGLSREKRGEHLLAAQSYTRLTGSFHGVALADVGLVRAREAYFVLRRMPQLGAGYGDLVLDSYRALLSDYPNSQLSHSARMKIATLTADRARKDYLTGQV